MRTYTEQERAIINEAAKNGYVGMDEGAASLIAEWIADQAREKALSDAQFESIQERNELETLILAGEYEEARAAMNERYNAAMERLKVAREMSVNE